MLRTSWKKRHTSRQPKPYRGFHSHVVHAHLQELQLAIADFTRYVKGNGGYRYCFVAVDCFSKCCFVITTKDNTP